jgi:ParB-like chromosome segregation protein Spo0J
MTEEIQYIEEQEIPLAELEYAPWNWKKEAEEKRERFRASLKKNGILYRLVVAQREEEPDSDKWEVCDGNHRLREYAELGQEKVKCYPVGRLSKAQRMRIGQELNGWEFETDQLLLAEAVAEMVKQLGIEELAQTSPLEESELTALNELLEFDFSQFDRPEGEESEDSVIVKIKLEFTPEQYEFFKEKSADLAGKTISEKILRLIGYEG